MINKQILNWSKYLDMKFNTVDEDGEWYINVTPLSEYGGRKIRSK